jgi:hypothetical protein
MIVVIQCAGSKRKNAGFLKTTDGIPVSFVAHPELAPPAVNCDYARPDDATWMQADQVRDPDKNQLAV